MLSDIIYIGIINNFEGFDLMVDTSLIDTNTKKASLMSVFAVLFCL